MKPNQIESENSNFLNHPYMELIFAHMYCSVIHSSKPYNNEKERKRFLD